MVSKSITLEEIRSILEEKSDPEIASFLSGYFKTGPGQYGEGDRFRGIRVPKLRKIARASRRLSAGDLLVLVTSPWHEDRLLALLVWVERFDKGGEKERERIYRAYLDHLRYINNWDLVDLSAPSIVGGYLWEHERGILYEMAGSESLWERRTAVMATFYFIRNNDFEDTLQIAEILLNDSEDLIHKAAGWMLRELGKRDQAREEIFLRKYYLKMPRTMLRYAIERFPEEQRQAWLKGKI